MRCRAQIRGFSLANFTLFAGLFITFYSFYQYFSNQNSLTSLGFVYGLPIALGGFALKYFPPSLPPSIPAPYPFRAASPHLCTHAQAVEDASMRSGIAERALASHLHCRKPPALQLATSLKDTRVSRVPERHAPHAPHAPHARATRVTRQETSRGVSV